jgi:hypothetical protein
MCPSSGAGSRAGTAHPARHPPCHRCPAFAAHLARGVATNVNMLSGIRPGYCVFFHTCAQRSQQHRLYEMSGIAAVALVWLRPRATAAHTTHADALMRSLVYPFVKLVLHFYNFSVYYLFFYDFLCIECNRVCCPASGSCPPTALVIQPLQQTSAAPLQVIPCTTCSCTDKQTNCWRPAISHSVSRACPAHSIILLVCVTP